MLRSNRAPIRARRLRHSLIEGLESRQLLSAAVLSAGTLNIRGSARADTITVGLDSQNPSMIDVSMNGKVHAFAAAGVQQIAINSAGGNDTVALGDSLTTPASVNCGAGNDNATAGGGTDVINGSVGNDHLTGGPGASTLEGGVGNDTIQAGTGACQIDAGTGQDSVQFNASSGVAASTLPSAVQNALATLAGGSTLGNVQSFQDNSQTYYGANVTGDGQTTRIVVDATGTPVGAPPPGAAPHGPGGAGAPAGAGAICGAVVSTDAAANTLTVSAGNPLGAPKTVTFTVTSTTTITADGTAEPLSSLAAGSIVQIQTTGANSTTATSVVVLDPHVGGNVSAVDTSANTITLALPDGTTKTYSVSSTAQVTVDGAAATLADVTTNSPAQLRLSATDGSVLAIDANPQPPTNPGGGNPGGGGGGGGGGATGPTQPAGIAGQIVSVDTTADTITLQTQSGTTTLYTVSSSATVTLDGAPSTLSALVAGDNAQLQSSSDGSTVVSISANSPAPTNPGGGNPGGGEPGNPTQPAGVAGLITAVDTSADTLTLQTQAGASTTYSVGSSATITLDGAASSLSALTAGDNAQLQLASDGTTVTSISANSQVSLPPTPPPVHPLPPVLPMPTDPVAPVGSATAS